jgi:hypothetical protein
MKRSLVSLLIALALAAPLAATAQTTPAAPGPTLSALTDSYFNAIAHSDEPVLSTMTSNTFHVIQPDGKRLNYDQFIRGVATLWFTAQNPSGNSQKITSSTITNTGATETVDTSRWYHGAINPDPMGGPGVEHDYATHQLTWIKSPKGNWLLDEDHITSAMNT